MPEQRYKFNVSVDIGDSGPIGISTSLHRVIKDEDGAVVDEEKHGEKTAMATEASVEQLLLSGLHNAFKRAKDSAPVGDLFAEREPPKAVAP